MTPYIKLFFIIYFAGSVTTIGEFAKKLPCGKYPGRFNLSDFLGPWHVVAVIPNTDFPKIKRLLCYTMDVSETDEAGLRWLVSKKVDTGSQKIMEKINGVVIRQRYNSDVPFDVWSREVPGVNGCFRELFSLGTNKTNLSDGSDPDTYMQLHMMFNKSDGTGPYLVQTMWGKLISGVIYRREDGPGTTMDNIMTPSDHVANVKGQKQLPAILCTTSERS